MASAAAELAQALAPGLAEAGLVRDRGADRMNAVFIVAFV
jgi:hypothetical protein